MRYCRFAFIASLVLMLRCSALASGSTITVLAAASLKESFTELGKAYERLHPGFTVRISFAGSQQLAAQIALGAPADVFASADTAQMDKVVQARKAASKSVKPLAYNALVLVVSNSASSKISGLQSIGDQGIKLLLGTPQVPVGEYSRAMLAKADKKFKGGWLAKVNANVVSQELDVRSILTKVELGVADAGVVYITDAKFAGSKVVTRPIPPKLNVTSTYLIAPIVGSELGPDFVRFVLSRAGRESLGSRGFLLPRP